MQESLDLLAASLRLGERRRVFDRVAGLWKDRDDLPDWGQMRREMDERVDRLWGES